MSFSSELKKDGFFLKTNRKKTTMPSLYVTDDLRGASVILPYPPLVLYVRLTSSDRICPAWLLTPGTYRRFLDKALAAEVLFLGGDLDKAIFGQLVERWAVIEKWAAEHLDPSGPKSTALAKPPALSSGWTPWDE